MKITALEFYKNGFMKEEFALGGSLDKAQIDLNKVYPASLQNYVIDTGKEIILVDTGLPVETPDFKCDPNAKLYMGDKINNFIDALHAAGYKEEDVDKVIITHKHPDHTGEIRKFSNAKIYISRTEADDMKLEGDNIIRVDFTDGKYKNYEKSQLISDGIVMLAGVGHTKGNSIVIIEDKDLYFMIHGDITYTDEALRRKQLSIVFEDKEEAFKTLDNATEFIKSNPVVYLSTHTPEALEALKNRTIMKLQ